MAWRPVEDGEAKIRRAVLASIRQELSAPVSTILGYTEMLLEDATLPEIAEFGDDLRRVHAAGSQLNLFVDRLVETAGAKTDETTAAAFQAWLRHDLRTPINAVKGYAEMMLEAAEEQGLDAFAADLKTLLAAATALLGRIEELVALDAVPGAAEGESASFLRGLEILKESMLPEVLPVVRPRTVEAPASRAATGRILVADDNDANRDLLSRRLVREGHQVVTVGNGMQALALACAQELDLILLDLMMPRLSGDEVLVRLKAMERTAHIPVIMISALDETESVVRCIEAGAEDYLPKPWNPIILRARVNACLEKKQLRDRERRYLDEIKQAKQKADALLRNVLPEPVIGRLHRGERVIADRFAEATVLFADIVGFTGFSAGTEAAQVVARLNDVFTAFDRIAGELGVEKVKTIGDCYMAVAGLPEPCADHATRVARLALRMLEAAAQHGGGLEVRIGMHSGPVAAGIIGVHKFAYDVWGDAVNIASRMESQGLPGEIQASEATFRPLQDAFVWAPRGTIHVKGKGPMATYLLRGVRDASPAVA